MKCPHCKEELGLNNICINPVCSYFSTTINSSEKDHLSTSENNVNNDSIYINSHPNKSNTSNFSIDPNLSNEYNTGNHNTFIENGSVNSKNINTDSYNNISTEDFAAFIGSHNTNYYLKYIDKMNENNKFLSWNWACFFLGPYWLLYRKLYAFAAIFLVANLGLSLLIPGGFSLIIRIVLSMFANAIYLNHSARKIRTVKTIIANLSATQYINKLQKKGGVNLAAPFILIGIYILVIVIIFSVYLSDTGIYPHNFSSPSYSF